MCIVPLGEFHPNDWPFQARSLDAEIDVDRMTTAQVAWTFRSDDQMLEVLTKESIKEEVFPGFAMPRLGLANENGPA